MCCLHEETIAELTETEKQKLHVELKLYKIGFWTGVILLGLSLLSSQMVPMDQENHFNTTIGQNND